jgi:predicted aconitase
VITDAELETVKAAYPVIWKNPNGKPQLCFNGCPHMTLKQLEDWTENIEKGLKKNGLKRVSVPTVFTASVGVLEEFEKTPYAEKLKSFGVTTSPICALMYMNNPLCKKKNVITSSNKLRTYTSAKFYSEEEILSIITNKEARL